MAVNWSGAKNRYTIKLIGGEAIDVTTTVVDAIAWERLNKRGYLDTGSPAYEQMLWTAWAAAKRQGKTDARTFNEFMPKVDDFAMISDDPDGTEPETDVDVTELSPTQPAPGPA